MDHFFSRTFPSLREFGVLRQEHLDWFTKRHGIAPLALCRPEPILVAKGTRADDGYIDLDDRGSEWLLFIEPEDAIFWQPRTNELATWNGRSFALGEAIIDNAWTYSFDPLRVYASPLEWLQADRDGIVIRDWSRCYCRLQDAPRIEIDEVLVDQFDRAMQPPRRPEILVRIKQRRAAA